ncbi:MAG: hypothetical protein DRP86_02460 [Candidatus Neomarinimicrobiota bacterium]|nr:MAG: hypothetical protein DRP86_02460 [Candidatus Neomarinimicrobiota bacterium]
MKSMILVLVFLMITAVSSGYGQTVSESDDVIEYKHAVDFCPLSPVMGIYAIHYTYRFSRESEFIIAPSYMNIEYEDVGHTDAPGFIVGYRRYLWKNLHIDYQLMPMWDRYYSEEESKTYPVGFDLWNEFRLGYSFDFKVKKISLFLNVQWPFGFALYSDPDGKPESFKERAEENPFFYFPPLFFIGFRF